MGVFVWLAVPVLCLAEPDPGVQFRQIALLILQQKLEKTGNRLSGEVMNQIAQETGLPPSEIRVKLYTLVDSLQVQRRQKTEQWQRLVQAGGKQIPPQVADKFLNTLLTEARRLVTKQADYDLLHIVEFAAQRAKIPPHEAKDFLLQAMSLGSGSSMPRLAGIPSKISLLVEVQDRTVDKGDAALSAELDSTGARRPDFANPMLPLLLQELPQSPRIKWAVDGSTKGQEPDYQLVVSIANFHDGREAGGVQTLSLTAKLVLKAVASDTRVYQRPLTVHYYPLAEAEGANSGEPVDELRSQACTKIRRALDDYLATR